MQNPAATHRPDNNDRLLYQLTTYVVMLNDENKLVFVNRVTTLHAQ